MKRLNEREKALFNVIADVEVALHIILHPMPNDDVRDKLWKLAKRLEDARVAYRDR